jgi:hypothetical protein
MVEKGDQGLDEMPSSSFEEASRLKRLRPATLDVEITPDESDDDESEDEEDVVSQATVDTAVVTDFKAIGLAMHDTTRCMVELALKVQGHHLYCGHLRHSCPRRKHRILQEIPGKTGSPGVYQQLPNTKGTICDAVADTLTTLEALEEQRQANRALLEKLGASKSKTAAEEAAKTRSDPVVRIDTTPRGPRATQVSGWARHLPQTPSSIKPTPGASSGQQSSTLPTTKTQPIIQKTMGVGTGTARVSGSKAAPPAPKTSAPNPLTSSSKYFSTGKTVTKHAPRNSAQARTASTSSTTAVTNPMPQPSGGAPANSDPALIAILSTMVDRFDQMTEAQNQMALTNSALIQQVTDQQAQAAQQQQQLDSLRSKAQHTARPGVSDVVPENVSIPSEASNRNKRFYAVARGRHTGVFTRWKDAEKSVKGFSGAIHKKFRSERAPWTGSETRHQKSVEISLKETRIRYTGLPATLMGRL